MYHREHTQNLYVQKKKYFSGWDSFSSDENSTPLNSVIIFFFGHTSFPCVTTIYDSPIYYNLLKTFFFFIYVLGIW